MPELEQQSQTEIHYQKPTAAEKPVQYELLSKGIFAFYIVIAVYLLIAHARSVVSDLPYIVTGNLIKEESMLWFLYVAGDIRKSIIITVVLILSLFLAGRKKVTYSWAGISIFVYLFSTGLMNILYEIYDSIAYSDLWTDPTWRLMGIREIVFGLLSILCAAAVWLYFAKGNLKKGSLAFIFVTDAALCACNFYYLYWHVYYYILHKDKLYKTPTLTDTIRQFMSVGFDFCLVVLILAAAFKLRKLSLSEGRTAL